MSQFHVGLSQDSRSDADLSRHAGDGVLGSLKRIYVEDVNERYTTFRSRGLDTTLRPESPIHTSPVDQTWGLREFSVTDQDEDGLCFCGPITTAEYQQTRFSEVMWPVGPNRNPLAEI